MNKNARTLTVQDIIDSYDNEAWLGFGYLGERRNAQDSSDPEAQPASPERIAQVDAFVVEVANRKHWTPERLFQWLNSRDGRHFGDDQLWGSAPVADRWNLIS